MTRRRGKRGLMIVGLVALGLAAALLWMRRSPAVHLEGLMPLDAGAIFITRAVDQPHSVIRRVDAQGDAIWETPLQGVLHDGSRHSSAIQGDRMLSLVSTPTGVDGLLIDLGDGQIKRRLALPAADTLFVAPRWDDAGAVRFVTRTDAGFGLGRWDPAQPALDWQTPIPGGRPTLSMQHGAITLLFNGRWWAVDAQGARFGFDQRFARGTCFAEDTAMSVTSDGVLIQGRGAPARVVDAQPRMTAQTCGHRGQHIVLFGSHAGWAAGMRVDPPSGRVVWSRRMTGLELVQTSAGVDWRDERWHPLRGPMLRAVPVPVSVGADQMQWLMLDMKTGELAWASAPLPSETYAGYFSFRSPDGLHHLVGDQGRHVLAFDGQDGALTGAVRGDVDRIRASHGVGDRLWAARSTPGSSATLRWITLDARSLREIARGHPVEPRVVDDRPQTAAQLGLAPPP